MTINARVAAMKRTDVYKFGAVVSNDTGDERLVLTVGLFRTYETAHAWARATLKLYRELPQEQAEQLELPDDWDLDRAN